ncbi:MAG: efflux transporter periplasmic adaptor subunit [Planctomycetes bacterium GWF2_42_9]|nr:MAG: efflux transporter periplasmic adaptor subunit [Planctomycetes bacterium GWF2_42_9]HAL45126.1 efflux transporter periplasmic adaptor subunit [Phycisphaerales bacterium]
MKNIKAKKVIKKIIISGLLSIVIISWCSLSGCKGKPQMMMPTPEVAIIKIQPQKAELTTELPGRTSAYRIAEIRPQVSGLIQKRLFTEGSDVNEGQVLYQIDPAPFEAAVNNVKASLSRAEATLPSIKLRAERYQELLADKAVSQQEYDDVTSSLKQAEAEIQFYKARLDSANIDLSYTKITAPISGRIGRSNITDGAMVTAYQPVALATIQQLDPIYVDVPQSTTEMLRLNRHLRDGKLNKNENQNKVKLFLEDGTEYPLMGALQFRDVTVDQTTASVTYRVVFQNPENILLPGMFTRVVVVEGVQEQAILIPQQSIMRDTKGNPLALIVNEDKAVEPRMLVIDRAIGNQWLVTSGLEIGDRLIVEGLQKVRPGAVVKTVLFKPNKEVVKTNEVKHTVEGE